MERMAAAWQGRKLEGIMVSDLLLADWLVTLLSTNCLRSLRVTISWDTLTALTGNGYIAAGLGVR